MKSTAPIALNHDSARAEPIVRLIRRICLLREQGKAGEAVRLEDTKLTPALETIRQEDGIGAMTDEQVEVIYAAERERAANTVMLADLIVEHLRDNFPSAGPEGRAATPNAAFPLQTREVPAGQTASGPPAIPDLLDAMLAHDRSAARRRASSSRSGARSTDKQTTHQNDNHDH